MAIARGDGIWYSAPGSVGGTDTGRNSTTPIGFSGVVPIATQVVATGATTAQIAAALAALGLTRLS